MTRQNLSYHLAERPQGEIVPGKTLTPKVSPAPTASDLKDGEVLVEVLYLSLDPSLRAQMNDRRSYVPPIQIGAVMNGICVNRVLASRSKLAAEGALVMAYTGFTQYAILKEAQFQLFATFNAGVQEPQDMVSALGPTGVTAWYGMVKIGDPKPGETVVVSAAAGATGSIAGQIAKIKGARVVGLAGSDDKCKWLTDELGFDVALNYKTADFKEKFAEATKDFIDVYFDNVGGEILDMCLVRAKPHARFVMCGAISQYNATAPPAIRYLAAVTTMRIRMEGFIISDHPKCLPQAREELSQWMAEGKLKKTETIIKGGLEKAEQALIDLFKGVNTGKLLVEVKNPAEAPSKL